jgi:hypothetical protein
VEPVKMILSRCEIHRGCTIEVFFGEKAGGRIPWPDPDLKPDAERDFPGSVPIQLAHLLKDGNAKARGAISTLTAEIAELRGVVPAVDKPPIEARKPASLLGSDHETDATRRGGCDEHDPAVIRNPRSLERSSRLPVGDVQHHHRLILTHVLGHILDRGASLVRHLFDLT